MSSDAVIDHNDSRELSIEQSHAGTLLLAALFGLFSTCIVASAALALFWQIADLAGWLVCLFLPVVFVVLMVGQWLFNWSGRMFTRLWPSRRRLLLDGTELTLSRRGRIKSRIRLNEPYSELRWRMRKSEASLGTGPNNGLLVLACQLTQGNNAIDVFTDSSAMDWRRVPGWKRFSLLKGEQRRTFGRFREHAIPLALPKRTAPSHRGMSSLEQGNPKELWPAELLRRRRGWELSFDDFCALMFAVQRSTDLREVDE